MKTLVVLPSYNESENIVQLVKALLNLGPNYDVCIVDDSSPDGTSELLSAEIQQNSSWKDRVHLIVRSKKDGRGGAVRDGFAWGYASSNKFDVFVEMDCDFSHEPSAIPQGVALLIQGADVALGSRYPDGEIIGWPLQRRAFSFVANLLVRMMVRWSICDYTNGFRFYQRRIVEFLLAMPQRHKGYIYLSESLSYLLKAGYSVSSFPIRFVNRVRGASNTNFSEIKNALVGILAIGFRYRFER
jgi:dolichol-phosphate mannosyltransferase